MDAVIKKRFPQYFSTRKELGITSFPTLGVLIIFMVFYSLVKQLWSDRQLDVSLIDPGVFILVEWAVLVWIFFWGVLAFIGLREVWIVLSKNCKDKILNRPLVLPVEMTVGDKGEKKVRLKDFPMEKVFGYSIRESKTTESFLLVSANPTAPECLDFQLYMSEKDLSFFRT